MIFFGNRLKNLKTHDDARLSGRFISAHIARLRLAAVSFCLWIFSAFSSVFLGLSSAGKSFFCLPIFSGKRLKMWGIALCIVALLLVAGSVGFVSVSPSKNFKLSTIFTIEEGLTLDQIADALKKEGYVRSKTVLKIAVKYIYRNDAGAVAGDYVFNEPMTALAVARKILTGDFDLLPKKITIPEGLNKFETAAVLARRLPDFDTEKFITLAPEGYLFPDTYFFVPNVTPEKVIEKMTENFGQQIQKFALDIVASERTPEDVLAMASIVETEARQFETRQIIAGILWKRIDEEMPLQVDVSFKYINGKTTNDLTRSDLEIDSPYNSYKYKGLPPTPISNPGLSSIDATLHPKDTDYYFFLSDSEGNMHYAETFAQHKKNIEKYL